VTGAAASDTSVDLRERVAIVTGGGRGLGRAIALGYARAGADVVITAARHPEQAEEVAATAAGLSGAVHALAADVTSMADVDRVVERALAIRGRIDVLVNNAARGMRFVNERFMTDPQPFWEADPKAWGMVMDTNIVGTFLMTRAVVVPMLAAGRGSIVNVTINHETMVRRGFSPYGPSKAALEAMTQVWAQELEGSGVHVNLLAPGGATDTGMVPEDRPAGVELLDPRIVVEPALYLALTDRSGQRILGTEWRDRG
jgi:NAD(P)-dependent dehydrogenase (short-subunit alcohol dehydrogenase family)